MSFPASAPGGPSGPRPIPIRSLSSGVRARLAEPDPDFAWQPPAWRDAATLAAVLTELVGSAQPAIAFASLAAACVPALADECAMLVCEQPRTAEAGPAGFAIHYPPGTVPAPARPGGASITAVVETGAEGNEPGYRVAATFRWHGPCRLENADQTIADLLVHRAVDLVSRHRLGAALEKALDTAAHLNVALETNRRIGEALGILMATYKLTDQQAFDLLRGASQHTHRKLRDVAEDVCQTGTLDLPDDRGRPAQRRARSGSTGDRR